MLKYTIVILIGIHSLIFIEVALTKKPFELEF